jgi:uncharacterized protein (TIGR02145 family)
MAMKKKSRHFIYLFVFIGVFLILANSCSKDENNNPTGPVLVLTTSAVNDIKQTTATCGGAITSDGGSAVIARGVCWSLGTNPTIANSKTTDGIGAGTFTSSLTGLSSGTIYYVRAYATTSTGTGYGNSFSFTTLPSASTVTDIDGNVYHTVTIGAQTWMVENLKLTKYRDGTPIPNVTNSTAWSKLTTGVYCDYDNTASNSTIYGKLYNWYAVNDSRKIAPAGWHVPTDAEWTILTTYLGGESVAGGKLKETGFTHWADPNTGATNETGFTALPGGGRDGADMAFVYVGYFGGWWSSTESVANNAYGRDMGNNYSYVKSYIGLFKASGFSVRCVKDK